MKRVDPKFKIPQFLNNQQKEVTRIPNVKINPILVLEPKKKKKKPKEKTEKFKNQTLEKILKYSHS
jgi:hypothetical protein